MILCIKGRSVVSAAENLGTQSRSEDLPTILHVHVHVALLGTVEAPIIATGDSVFGGVAVCIGRVAGCHPPDFRRHPKHATRTASTASQCCATAPTSSKGKSAASATSTSHAPRRHQDHLKKRVDYWATSTWPNWQPFRPNAPAQVRTKATHPFSVLAVAARLMLQMLFLFAGAI